MGIEFKSAKRIRDLTDEVNTITGKDDKTLSQAVHTLEDGYGKYDAGVEDGKREQYDAFWDIYQDFGKRDKYEGAFYGLGWTEENFKPKYDIILGNGYTGTDMFANTRNMYKLKSLLDGLGVKLDTSKCWFMSGLFRNSKIEDVPVIDASGAVNSGGTANLFIASEVKSIEKLIFSENTSISSNMFSTAYYLENVIFDGVMSKMNDGGLNMKDCVNINKPSIISLINTLSTSTTNFSITLSKIAVDKAFETSQDAANGSTSEEWLTLVGSKPNWSISLSTYVPTY